jgi:hypothetical protein
MTCTLDLCLDVQPTLIKSDATEFLEEEFLFPLRFVMMPTIDEEKCKEWEEVERRRRRGIRVSERFT